MSLYGCRMAKDNLKASTITVQVSQLGTNSGCELFKLVKREFGKKK